MLQTNLFRRKNEINQRKNPGLDITSQLLPNGARIQVAPTFWLGRFRSYTAKIIWTIRKQVEMAQKYKHSFNKSTNIKDGR